MDYAECLASCIATLRADNDARAETDVAMLSCYPVPTRQEWANVLDATAKYENIEDPFACMGQYEIRLHQRGFQTVLDSVVAEYKAIAARVGLPEEFLADAIVLSDLINEPLTQARH